MSSLMRTTPSPSTSAERQTSIAAEPSAMFTALMRSSIVTAPSLPQSPRQDVIGAVLVGVEPGGDVLVGLASGADVLVEVGGGDVLVGVEPGGAVLVEVGGGDVVVGVE